ncbi:hypothetical protein [Actinopolymorpha alba]|uniref:hypothetical protein n=1 Tax=Actinopolymorpha alba TaxID=533267 RepID=UPI0003741DC7|nr:hypothetical protein [Actinopolymorpha alba]
MAIPKAARVTLALVVAAGVVVAGSFALSNALFRQVLTEGCQATVGGVTTRLTVEEAENAALISALSVQRGMPARAASIALATAYQESGLRNINYGHLDSLGLFQQRPSQGWGTPEEILDPYYSSGRFYTALAKVKDYPSLEIAEAAQLVQRSADGNAYAQHETNARTLASSLTGQSGAAFSCELRPPTAAQADDLRTELLKAFGTGSSGSPSGPQGIRGRVAAPKTPTPSNDGDAPVVDIPISASTQALGWSMAQWSVAYAKRFGVVSVSYAGRSWSVDSSKEGWRADPEAPSGRVRIVLATPQ